MLKSRILNKTLFGVMLLSATSLNNANSETAANNAVNPSDKHSGDVTENVNLKKHIELLDFLQKAYDTNPDLQSARYARNAQEAELLSTMYRFTPTINLSAQWSYTNDRIPQNLQDPNGQQLPNYMSFADNLSSLTKKNLDANGTIGAGLNLFRFGSDAFAMMGATAKQEGYDIDQFGKIQKFILDAVESYINVLKGRQTLDVYTKFERQARYNFERVQTEYTVGSSTRTNVLTAKAQLAQATSNRMKAQTDLINAEQVYISMSGDPAGNLVYPKDTFSLPTSLENCLKIAQERSLSLRGGAANLRAARYGLASTIAGSLPSVDLSVQYSKPLKDIDNNNGGSGTVGISISYQLLNPQGIGLPQIKQATHQQQAARYAYENSISVMERDVKAAWNGLKTAESQLTQAQLGVDAARNAYEGALEEFRLGHRSYLDLLQVQEQLLKAELNYIESTKANILGRYQLLASIGILTPEIVGLKLNTRDERQ